MPPLPFRRFPAVPTQHLALVGTARTLDALAKDGAASAAQADAPSRSGTSIT
jgi:hypothetical protein